MSANLDLIDNINNQREKNRSLKREVQADIGRIRQMAQKRDLKAKKSGKTTNSQLTMKPLTSMPTHSAPDEIDPTNILERNRQRILALRAAIGELESRRTSVKATSILPPLEPNQTTEPRIAFYTQAQNADELASPRGNDAPADAVVPPAETIE